MLSANYSASTITLMFTLTSVCKCKVTSNSPTWRKEPSFKRISRRSTGIPASLSASAISWLDTEPNNLLEFVNESTCFSDNVKESEKKKIIKVDLSNTLKLQENKNSLSPKFQNIYTKRVNLDLSQIENKNKSYERCQSEKKLKIDCNLLNKMPNDPPASPRTLTSVRFFSKTQTSSRGNHTTNSSFEEIRSVYNENSFDENLLNTKLAGFIKFRY